MEERTRRTWHVKQTQFIHRVPHEEECAPQFHPSPLLQQLASAPMVTMTRLCGCTDPTTDQSHLWTAPDSPALAAYDFVPAELRLHGLRSVAKLLFFTTLIPWVALRPIVQGALHFPNGNSAPFRQTLGRLPTLLFPTPIFKKYTNKATVRGGPGIGTVQDRGGVKLAADDDRKDQPAQGPGPHASSRPGGHQTKSHRGLDTASLTLKG